MSTETIRRLLDEVSELAQSPRNQHLTGLWESVPPPAMDRFRGTPRPGRVACVVEPSPLIWSRLWGFDIRKYYTDPDTKLEFYLRGILHQFKELGDDRPLQKILPIFLGVGFESTLFGAQTVYVPDQEPWPPREPVLQGTEGLDELKQPDLYTSGLMPLAHRFYDRWRKLAGDEFTILIPDWRRSPFGVACQLRGVENLLMDLLLRPRFAHRLLRFLTDCRKRFATDRAAFCGTELYPCYLANDEVNSPSLSVKLYREFVLPYEKELCEFYGGCGQWCSDGDITPFLPGLAEMPDLRMVQVNPWTDLAEAVEIFGQETALQFTLHPIDDIWLADDGRIEDRLHGIIAACQSREVRAFYIRTGPLHPFGHVNEDLRRIIEWIRLARRTVQEITG